MRRLLRRQDVLDRRGVVARAHLQHQHPLCDHRLRGIRRRKHAVGRERGRIEAVRLDDEGIASPQREVGRVVEPAHASLAGFRAPPHDRFASQAERGELRVRVEHHGPTLRTGVQRDQPRRLVQPLLHYEDRATRPLLATDFLPPAWGLPIAHPGSIKRARPVNAWDEIEHVRRRIPRDDVQ